MNTPAKPPAGSSKASNTSTAASSPSRPTSNSSRMNSRNSKTPPSKTGPRSAPKSLGLSSSTPSTRNNATPRGPLHRRRRYPEDHQAHHHRPVGKSHRQGQFPQGPPRIAPTHAGLPRPRPRLWQRQLPLPRLPPTQTPRKTTPRQAQRRLQTPIRRPDAVLLRHRPPVLRHGHQPLRRRTRQGHDDDRPQARHRRAAHGRGCAATRQPRRQFPGLRRPDRPQQLPLRPDPGR